MSPWSDSNYEMLAWSKSLAAHWDLLTSWVAYTLYKKIYIYAVLTFRRCLYFIPDHIEIRINASVSHFSSVQFFLTTISLEPAWSGFKNNRKIHVYCTKPSCYVFIPGYSTSKFIISLSICMKLFCLIWTSIASVPDAWYLEHIRGWLNVSPEKFGLICCKLDSPKFRTSNHMQWVSIPIYT